MNDETTLEEEDITALVKPSTGRLWPSVRGREVGGSAYSLLWLYQYDDMNTAVVTAI